MLVFFKYILSVAYIHFSTILFLSACLIFIKYWVYFFFYRSLSWKQETIHFRCRTMLMPKIIIFLNKFYSYYILHLTFLYINRKHVKQLQCNIYTKEATPKRFFQLWILPSSSLLLYSHNWNNEHLLFKLLP